MAAAESDTGPLYVHTKTVQPEWLDHNGHMNDSFYTYVAGYGFDAMLESFGLDQAYRDRTHCTTYSLETRTWYLDEAKLGDPIDVHAQVLDADEKRVHLFVIMSNPETGEPYAMTEGLYAHVDQDAGPKTAPFPDTIREPLFALRDAHAALPRPDRTINLIGIRRKPKP